MRSLAALTIAAALLLGSCSSCGPDKNEAIESLTESQPSSRYDAGYWQAEAEAETPTWTQAVEICHEEANQRLPNCKIVLSTALIRGLESAADQPFPEYGEGRGSTGTPQGLEEAAEDLQPDSAESGEDEENDP